MTSPSLSCARTICAAALLGVASIGLAADRPAAPGASKNAFVLWTFAEHYAPRAAQFVAASATFRRNLEDLCATPANITADKLDAARAGWTSTMLAWETVGAITFGPLFYRRSTYRIDAWPVRRIGLDGAISRKAASLEELAPIAANLKGLPAIEALLWPFPPRNDPLRTLGDEPDRCAYAALLARDIEGEAKDIETAVARLVTEGEPADPAAASFAKLLNQTLGAIEQLAERKMYTDDTGPTGRGRDFPRAVSRNTLAAWNAQWLSIQHLLVGGAGAAGGIEGYLRANGHVAAATRLRAEVDRATVTLRETTAATPATARVVTRDLAGVRAALTEDVAAALKTTIRFSETDGD